MAGETNKQEALNQLMGYLISHDEIRRAWIQFLITVEAGVVLGLWALVSFGKELPGFLAIGGCWAIVGFGIGTAQHMMAIIARVHAWSNWYQNRAAKLANELGLDIFPNQCQLDVKVTVDEHATGHVHQILHLWKCLFFIVLIASSSFVTAWKLVELRDQDAKPTAANSTATALPPGQIAK